MSKAKMTLIGLENYCQGAGESLFTGLVLPTGINKDDVVNTILMRAGEFEILYSDPIFLKASISLWGRNWFATFERWLETLTEEYNPLHNYDRTEEILEKIDEDTKSHNSGTGTSSSTMNDSSSSRTDVDDTDTTSVSAYNTSSFDNSDKSVHDGQTTSNDSSQSSGQNTSSNSNDGTENKDIVRDHKARMFGNIGITTSATMATEELTLRGKYVLNMMIADTFVKEFCLMVY